MGNFWRSLGLPPGAARSPRRRPTGSSSSQDSAARDARLTFGRLLEFARPYVAVVLLALLCSFAYAGGRTLRAYLMKPLMDDVLIPAGDLAATESFGWPLFGSHEQELPEAPDVAVPGVVVCLTLALAENVRRISTNWALLPDLDRYWFPD